MSFLKKTQAPPPAAHPPVPQPKPKVEVPSGPPEVIADLCVSLEPDPVGAPRQRGAIGGARAQLLSLQLKWADMLRKSIAPDVALDLPLERTVERTRLVEQRFAQAMQQGHLKLPPNVTQEEFYNNVLDELFGYGPIEKLTQSSLITEIMVNGPYIVYVEHKGRIWETGRKFLDDDHVERIVRRIVKPLGRLADADHPLIDARLPDGSRVNAVIRPCAIDGPNITIRKFSKDKLKVNDLLNFGSLTQDIATFLEAAVVARRNIIVSGGTGSGKTTLINILSDHIPEHERTVTIEDAAELQLRQRNVVRLETKKPTADSPGEVTIRSCVINALRMRPERIVVGECRGGEALDMLQAMNTGHDGSMTTIHANSPRDCLSRLETLVLMAGVDLPLITVRKQVASAIHMIVQAGRMRDGSRKITHVSEIIGMEGETIVMQDIFKFVDQGDGPDGKIKGQHEPTGMRPSCDAVLKQYGFDLPGSMFMK
ncbi:MAG: CpaF family protein [Thermoflexales bacterium]|nr:CpaF family protein [Thermoflexales bacterium]